MRDEPAPNAFGAANPPAAFGHPLSYASAKDVVDSLPPVRHDLHGSFEMLDAHAGPPGARHPSFLCGSC